MGGGEGGGGGREGGREADVLCHWSCCLQGEGFELYEDYCKNRPNSEEVLQEMRGVEQMFLHVSGWW